MAKIILKCRYLKQSNGKHTQNLIQYIAKREGVEKIDDSWKVKPVTAKQKRVIEDILKDFPNSRDSFEYQDYSKAPNRGTASAFIFSAVEENADLLGKRENYVEYIARRPHVERSGTHGLFTDQNVPIVLSRVSEEVAAHQGNVWTNVLSLRREDAERLGYDNAAAWRDLLRSQAGMMAACMKIPMEDLRWYAAFHNEGHHPHVHIVAYSIGREAYLSEQGILQMKSAFAREIFKQDLLQVYEKQTTYRDALISESRLQMEEIMTAIEQGHFENQNVEILLETLSEKLKNAKGKKNYGYLPQNLRNLVNSIVDELGKEPGIEKLYDLWYQQREEITGPYQESNAPRLALSQNKTFKSIKNMVIKEALTLNVKALDEMKLDENASEMRVGKETETGLVCGLQKETEHKVLPAAYTRLLRHLAGTFRSQIKEDVKKIAADRKLKKEIEEKKKAHGLKTDFSQRL